MDIQLPYSLGENVAQIMRRAGYAASTNPENNITSYTRRLGRDWYPRFHVYVEERDGVRLIKLHLDQKKPSYAGAHAHNADYDGPQVEAELQRIQGIIASESNEQSQQPEAKKTFLQKLFR